MSDNARWLLIIPIDIDKCSSCCWKWIITLLPDDGHWLYAFCSMYVMLSILRYVGQSTVSTRWLTNLFFLTSSSFRSFFCHSSEWAIDVLQCCRPPAGTCGSRTSWPDMIRSQRLESIFGRAWWQFRWVVHAHMYIYLPIAALIRRSQMHS